MGNAHTIPTEDRIALRAVLDIGPEDVVKDLKPLLQADIHSVCEAHRRFSQNGDRQVSVQTVQDLLGVARSVADALALHRPKVCVVDVLGVLVLCCKSHMLTKIRVMASLFKTDCGLLDFDTFRDIIKVSLVACCSVRQRSIASICGRSQLPEQLAQQWFKPFGPKIHLDKFMSIAQAQEAFVNCLRRFARGVSEQRVILEPWPLDSEVEVEAQHGEENSRGSSKGSVRRSLAESVETKFSKEKSPKLSSILPVQDQTPSTRCPSSWSPCSSQLTVQTPRRPHSAGPVGPRSRTVSWNSLATPRSVSSRSKTPSHGATPVRKENPALSEELWADHDGPPTRTGYLTGPFQPLEERMLAELVELHEKRERAVRAQRSEEAGDLAREMDELKKDIMDEVNDGRRKDNYRAELHKVLRGDRPEVPVPRYRLWSCSRAHANLGGALPPGCEKPISAKDLQNAVLEGREEIDEYDDDEGMSSWGSSLGLSSRSLGLRDAVLKRSKAANDKPLPRHRAATIRRGTVGFNPDRRGTVIKQGGKEDTPKAPTGIRPNDVILAYHMFQVLDKDQDGTLVIREFLASLEEDKQCRAVPGTAHEVASAFLAVASKRDPLLRPRGPEHGFSKVKVDPRNKPFGYVATNALTFKMFLQCLWPLSTKSDMSVMMEWVHRHIEKNRTRLEKIKAKKPEKPECMLLEMIQVFDHFDQDEDGWVSLDTVDAYLQGAALTHRDRKVAEKFEALHHGRSTVHHEEHEEGNDHTANKSSTKTLESSATKPSVNTALHRMKEINIPYGTTAYGRCSVEHEVHVDHIENVRFYQLQTHLVEDKSSWLVVAKPFENLDTSRGLKKVNFAGAEKKTADPLVRFVRAVERRMEQLAEFLSEQTGDKYGATAEGGQILAITQPHFERTGLKCGCCIPIKTGEFNPDVKNDPAFGSPPNSPRSPKGEKNTSKAPRGRGIVKKTAANMTNDSVATAANSTDALDDSHEFPKAAQEDCVNCVPLARLYWKYLLCSALKMGAEAPDFKVHPEGKIDLVDWVRVLNPYQLRLVDHPPTAQALRQAAMDWRSIGPR